MSAETVDLDSVERRTLIVLADLAVTGRAFRRCGVRGWVPGPEVKTLVRSSGAGWRLPRLRGLHFITSQAIPDAGRPRNPLVMWRITQAGEDAIAELADRAPRRIPRPREDAKDQHQIYVGRQAWELLLFLQRHNGWLTWADAVREATAEFRSRFWHDPLTILVKRGLARREKRTGSPKDIVWVTATKTGRQVEATDLKASTTMVQLRIPPVDPSD